MKTLVVALLALAPVWSRAPSYSQMRGPRTKRVAIIALAKQERFARDVDKLITDASSDGGFQGAVAELGMRLGYERLFECLEHDILSIRRSRLKLPSDRSM